MVDKGFVIDQICLKYGINLARPHFLRSKKQISESDAKENVLIYLLMVLASILIYNHQRPMVIYIANKNTFTVFLLGNILQNYTRESK